MKKVELKQTAFPFLVLPIEVSEGNWITQVLSCIVVTYLAERVEHGEYRLRTSVKTETLDLTEFTVFGTIQPGKKILLSVELWTLLERDKHNDRRWFERWRDFGEKDEQIEGIFDIEMLISFMEQFVQGRLKDGDRMGHAYVSNIDGIELLNIPSCGRSMFFTRAQVTTALSNYKNNISIFDQSTKLDFKSITIDPKRVQGGLE